MSAAELLRDFADVLDTFGPEATMEDMDPSVGAVIGRATLEDLRSAHGVLIGALDRLRVRPTPRQGAAELRKLADEIDPLVEVEVETHVDGCWCLGDPPPEGPPYSNETGGPYLA